MCPISSNKSYTASKKLLGKKENGRKGLLPSARGLPLHAHGLLLLRLLHGLFGAAAAIEEQQIPRVLIKITLAGLGSRQDLCANLFAGSG